MFNPDDVFYPYMNSRKPYHIHLKNFTVNFHASNIPSNFCINGKYILYISSLHNRLETMISEKDNRSYWSTLKIKDPIEFFMEQYKILVLNERDI